MKRIKEIKIKNFKAFQQEQVFPINGKNVLVYGNNGSGKSSLFWALYTFLQSSIKPNDDEVRKYFVDYVEGDTATNQTLKNIYAEEGEEAFIEIQINENAGDVRTLRIDENNFPTRPANNGNDTSIQELNLGSDFINYKLLHNFYNASHKNEINLWPVFEKDIFPFMTRGTTNWMDYIKNATLNVPRRTNGTKRSGRAKENFENQILALNTELEIILDEIKTTANPFIKKHFFDNNDVIKINLSFTGRFNYNLIANQLWQNENRYNHLKIKLTVDINKSKSDTPEWQTLHRVQSFLNESMLTRIAIAIRIGALRTRVQNTEFKILVLDDMLISLDMSNRMEMVKVILNTENEAELNRIFGGFQKFIFTHDLGFYELIRRHTNPDEWEYFKFHTSENIEQPPFVKLDKARIDKAIEYLKEGEYDACGNELRKETEAVLDKYLKGLNMASTGEFEPLMSKLNKALNNVTIQDYSKFKKTFVSRGLPVNLLEKLKTNFEEDVTLTLEEKGKLRSLKNNLIDYLIDQVNFNNNSERLILETKDILKRIMNPASHASLVPIYEAELKNAIAGVTALKAILNE